MIFLKNDQVKQHALFSAIQAYTCVVWIDRGISYADASSLTLRGEWRVEPSRAVIATKISNGETIISMKCQHGLTSELKLIQSSAE
ncbi:hypothetical protein SAMN04488029_1684 [Reichenbachiella faecimaris]|uniref:Uncharacterized protein n=1 Tax=Reichenbachiella faecimaris TaxID=692418 RepID=A0A1W2GBB8_REIFA|nr:hypothetical protein [Reichenbachiella faecimaris]SMD33814.1 hypothetical protein SAMN04488029_1684 [Reichenbachiella faecimaris]